MYINLLPLFSLVLSFYLFKKVSGSLEVTKLNMISWIFYFQLLLQCFIASVLTLNGWNDHYVLSTASAEAILYGSLAIQYTMVALPLGMWIGCVLLGSSSNTVLFDRFLKKDITFVFDDKDNDIIFVLYLFSLIAVFSVLYVIFTVGKVPLFSIFSNLDSLDIANMRQSASRNFSGLVLVKNIFAIMLTPLLAYISYCYWQFNKNRKNLIWFLIMLFSSIVILTYDLSKSPVIFFSVGFIFLKVFIDGGVKKKFVIIFSLTVVVFFGICLYIPHEFK